MSLSSWIKYLNDPNLVLQIQKYFGVVKAKDNYRSNKKVSTKSKESANEESINKLKYVNGSISNRKNDLDETLSSESDVESTEYVITNKFWYFLFIFGTELGDELFYATFIPFWFWNVDGAVGRRVVMVWAILMYVGQGIKDIVCWPRPPSPPVFRLQKKWSLEYGMPSTHAMVGVSIPFSVLLFTVARYQYPAILGFGIAVAWCSVVSISRLYLGMHSVLDVICGLLLALILMVPLIPLVDYLDYYILTSHWSPVFLLATTISLIIFYPKYGQKWTPTRGDTAVVLSVCAGVHIGAWTNYHLGQMTAPLDPPPYAIIWPSYNMIGSEEQHFDTFDARESLEIAEILPDLSVKKKKKVKKKVSKVQSSVELVEADEAKEEPEGPELKGVREIKTVPLVCLDEISQPEYEKPPSTGLMPMEYLQTYVGKHLVAGLAQVALYMPEDPVEYLAHWLIKERKKETLLDEMKQFKAEVKQFRNINITEMKKKSQIDYLKEETIQKYQEGKDEPLYPTFDTSESDFDGKSFDIAEQTAEEEIDYID